MKIMSLFAWLFGLREQARQTVVESVATEIAVAGVVMREKALAEAEAVAREAEDQGDHETAEAIRQEIARLRYQPAPAPSGNAPALPQSPQEAAQRYPALPKQNRRPRQPKAGPALPAPEPSRDGPEFDDRPF